ncbi:MAG: ABC transporter permease, partial [Opitutaceae bacterium]
MKFWHKFTALFRAKKLDAEMSEEMRLHLERRVEENIADGMSAEEARFAARRKFGGVEQVKEVAREQRGFLWIEQTKQDISHALRALVRNKSFTSVAVLTLALGIGVNTALFTVFNAVALRPLPLKDPGQLVDVKGIADTGWRTSWFSYADYLDVREARNGFEGFAAWMPHVMGLDTGDRRATSFFLRNASGTVSSNVPIELVSENYFALLGGRIVLGRGFLPEENTTPGSHPVIVLQHRFWEEQFSGDPNVIGQPLKLRGATFTIIGVTAPGFVGKTPAPPIGWIPAMMLEVGNGNGAKDLANRDFARFGLVGRLRSGIARETARAEVEVLIRQLVLQYPHRDQIKRVELRSATTFMPMALDWRTLGVTAPVWLGFLFVLVIACANVANLLLARACTRQQEIGVRLALGATRGRIIRHLLTESTLIALAGGAAGVLVTTWLLHILRLQIIALVPPTRMGARDWLFLNLQPDYRVFAFTLALAFIAAVAAGLFPAWLASRANVNASLKNDGSAFSRPSRVRHALVVAQVALCVTLLAASALLVRHVMRLAWIETGLTTENVFTGQFSLVPTNFQELEATVQRQLAEESSTPSARARAIEAARQLPGIAGIAQAYREPYSDRMWLTSVTLESAGAVEGSQLAKFNLVSAEYFPLLGLSPRRGRLFTAQEVAAEAHVVVISESTAQHFWPGENAIGRQLKVATIAFKGGWQDPWKARRDPPGAYEQFEVVGVVPDARSGLVSEPDDTMLYLPLRVDGTPSLTTLIHLTGPRDVMLPLLESAVKTRGLGLGFSLHKSLDEGRSMQLLPFKGVAAVAAALGGLAGLPADHSGAAACRGRALWRDGFCREPTRAGNRDPHGAWRDLRTGSAIFRRPGHATRRHWPRRGQPRRPRRADYSFTRDRRRAAIRPRPARVRRRAARRRHIGRLLAPGAPRGEGRSHGGATSGMRRKRSSEHRVASSAHVEPT